MTKNRPSLPKGNHFNKKALSSNEQAIIGSIRMPLLRKAFTQIWHLKRRLQFTGWLQYIPLALLMITCFLTTAVIYILGYVPVASIFGIIGMLAFALLSFDLLTVKFRLRLPESFPRRNDDLNIFDLMRVRRSCRSFQTRKLKSADYRELMESVEFHSNRSSIGNTPVRFEYISAPLTVWPTVNASEFLVAIAPKEYNRLAIIDVGHSLQKIVIDATRMGLGTCWIGPGADQSSIEQYLGDCYSPEDDHIVCVCAIGYKSWYIPTFLRLFNAQLNSRLLLSELFFADPSMTKPLDLDAHPFKQFGRNYEICQWAPSSYNGQTTRCVVAMEQDEVGGSRLARFDFYVVTESRYYAAVAVGIWCANWELGCGSLGISGSFAVLSTMERGLADEKAHSQLPMYDVSWLVDKGVQSIT